MNFETISVNKIDEYVRDINSIIIDIRSPSEYYKGHIPSAINIPYSDFGKSVGNLTKEKFLIIYCERGGTSLILSRELAKKGYRVKNIYGGINAYRGKLAP